MTDILLEAELILMAAIMLRKCKDCLFCSETPLGRYVCSQLEPDHGDVDPSDECMYPESENYIFSMMVGATIAASLPDRLKWLLPWTTFEELMEGWDDEGRWVGRR